MPTENIGWRSAVLDSLFWDPISDHTDSDDESIAATSWSEDEEGMSLLDATTDMEDTPGDSKEDVSKSDVMPRDLSLLQRKTPQGHLTRIITDGAKLYPKIARDFSLKHHAGNHSKRVFCVCTRIWESGRSKRLMVHTGSLDGFWKHLKGYIPDSVSSEPLSFGK